MLVIWTRPDVRAAALSIVSFLAFPGPLASAPTVAAATQPGEVLEEFTPPDGATLPKGSDITIMAVVEMMPSSVEAAYYTADVTINGHRERQFETLLLPPGQFGNETLKERLTWYVRTRGPRTMSVRFRSSATGASSGTTYPFSDVARTLRVVCTPREFWLFREIEILFRRCWRA